MGFCSPPSLLGHRSPEVQCHAEGVTAVQVWIGVHPALWEWDIPPLRGTGTIESQREGDRNLQMQLYVVCADGDHCSCHVLLRERHC